MAFPALPLVDPVVAVLATPACPSCRATATVCTGKATSLDAYWRCERCGDVWNPARVASAPRSWRA